MGLDPRSGLYFVGPDCEGVVPSEEASNRLEGCLIGRQVLGGGEIGEWFIGKRHSYLPVRQANVASVIHDDHPFQTPPEDRDPVRQFRGRLVSPVTVVTAGQPRRPAGLTVSSLMIAEGEPASVFLLIGTTTDLWDAIEESGRFVVHIVDDDRRDDADAFAGIRPRPGGAFAGVEVVESDWGPVFPALPNRLYCRRTGDRALPFHHLVEAEVEEVELDDLSDPAVYFRGGYRRLE